MDICLERRADLHMAQLMPLPLTVSGFSKIQIGFTFLVPAHLGSPGQRAVERVCVCAYMIGKRDKDHPTILKCMCRAEQYVEMYVQVFVWACIHA